MSAFINKSLNKIKKNLDIWFFYAFLLTFSLSTRKVLFFSPIKNEFNEYTGIYIYISDFFLIITLLNWLFLLYNKKYNLSIYKIWLKDFIHNLSLLLPFILLFWTFVSILLSDNKIISLFRSFKLMEYYFLYLYIIFRFVPFIISQNSKKSSYFSKEQSKCSTWNIKRGKMVKNLNFQQLSTTYIQTPIKYSENKQNVPRGTLEKINFSFKNIFTIIIYSALIQSLLAIFQFLKQKSIGFIFLKESFLSPEKYGVAKITIDGNIYIRAYGFFPHPNILGGFLLFSIIITILYLKMFHMEHFKENWERQSKCSTWNIFKKWLKSNILYFYQKIIHLILDFFSKNKQNVPRGTLKDFSIFKNYSFLIMCKKNIPEFSLIIQIIALILSFSKSAILGLIFAIFFILWKQTKCSTWNIKRGKMAKNLNFQQLSTTYIQTPIKYSENKQNVPRGTFSKNDLNQILLTIIKKTKSIFYFFSKKSIKIFYIETWKIILLTFFVFLISFSFFQKNDLQSSFIQSFEERLFYLNVSRETIFKNYSLNFFGIGMGSFVPNITNFSKNKPLIWQYQPVHNIFLLIWSELGIIGITLFLVWIWSMFHVEHWKKHYKEKTKCSTWNIKRGKMAKNLNFQQLSTTYIQTPIKYSENKQNVPRGTFCLKILSKINTSLHQLNKTKNNKNKEKILDNNSSILYNKFNILSIDTLHFFQGIFSGFIFIGLFDHYLWDIQQGSFLFWITAGFITAIKRKKI